MQGFAQRVGGADGDVFIELDEFQTVDQDLVVQLLGDQGGIGVDHGIEDGLDAVAEWDTAVAGAYQQAGNGC